VSNYLKKLIIEPGTKVNLSDYDPGYHGKHESPEQAAPELQDHVQKMEKLQYLMFAENKHSLLIVLQGLDAGGKDGVVRHVISGMNPSSCKVASFKQPTPPELDHDFLWRVHPHAPGKGEVAIFNRSHYEDVLIARVHKLVPEKVWSKRYDLINDFEKNLVIENNTTILKFFLFISPDEQLARFKQRLEDPARQWKISDSDYKERKYWNDYIEAFEEMLRKTSTERAPWFVIPANHKWFRNLAISQIITRTLEDMEMKPPAPTVDIDEIRRLYHAAEKQSTADNK
jgi:PPK2 family polyphosphate:nucleotide phosphotransferase